jgi:3D-(3,5/4)-trihydroxycyclohexane-1,2-dione acylhydrolase (decyclizing)
MSSTARLTVGQAIVRFLAAQHTVRDGVERPLFAGVLGIFGHGNVAGLGQALMQEQELLRYVPARNEQAMVHIASGYAKASGRMQTWACTSSIGPGATNMVTGAALATVNRLPVLLLPGDVFATRRPGTVLQQLEQPGSLEVSVNDAFRPVCRYWDRVSRPEQLPSALLSAARVLTDQAETGAVCLALPQDVQAEAWEFPAELFEHRRWLIPRALPDADLLARAGQLIRAAKRPLIVAGGGVIYSEAWDALRALADASGIPVAETQAGKGSLPYDHPLALGAIGSTGTFAANRFAREADVVIGVGTRYSDFTTASQSAFAQDATFVNLNVAAVDASKQSALPLVGDARVTLEALADALADHSVDPGYRARAGELNREWDAEVGRLYARDQAPVFAQSAVIGAVNEVSVARDVVVCAAGSMPGDLHKLWRTRDPHGYHLEYGYSCMGYELPGGIGVRLAAPDREVFVMVGDGTWLMMSGELATAIQEDVKLVIVLVDSGGYASIGALSESVGSQRFGTQLRRRDSQGRIRVDGDVLPIDLAANIESFGIEVLRPQTVTELRDALRRAREATETTAVYVRTDPLVGVPGYESWWDVPVAETSTVESVQRARAGYEEALRGVHSHVAPVDPLPEGSA